jgi:hypothetical protein
MHQCGQIEIEVPGVPGLRLCAGVVPAGAIPAGSAGDTGACAAGYRTAAIQRGLRLELNGRDLGGEGLGFAVPVVRYGSLTVFPGELAVECAGTDGGGTVALRFDLNLVERVSLGRRPPIQSERFYRVREYLAGLHRRYRRWRRFFSWGARVMMGTGRASVLYSTVPSVGTVPVLCRLASNGKRLQVEADLSGLAPGFTEVSLMNELDGGLFDHYVDVCTGVLRGGAIGTWDEVRAPAARFTDTADGLAFELSRVDGACLYRGREVVPGELSWAGLAHVVPAGTRCLSYEVSLGAAASRPGGCLEGVPA